MIAVKKDTKKSSKHGLIQAIGTRKQSIARVTIRPGNGVVRVNSSILASYQPALARERIMEPLILAGAVADKVNIDVNLHGGGVMSGADATRLGIARALVTYTGDENLRQTFLSYDRNLLVADVRFKEPCKPNDSKARAARQKSYR